MNLSQAFDKTLKDLNISARWLSRKSGVGERMISSFRNSRQRIYSDTLDKLIDALPLNAKKHFFGLLLGNKISLEELVAEMDEAGLSALLLLIAARISPQPSNKSATSLSVGQQVKIAFSPEQSIEVELQTGDRIGSTKKRILT